MNLPTLTSKTHDQIRLLRSSNAENKLYLAVSTALDNLLEAVGLEAA
jgi:hypothetical protein